MTTSQEIADYVSGLTDALNRMDKEGIERMVETLVRAYESDSTVYICGNGGSGATASHIVCDFNKGISLHADRKFRFICLNDNIATMLAISNDICYEDVFLIQAEGRVREGDILIAISGSGNSKNILRVVDYFKGLGNTVVGLSGYSGGRLRELSDRMAEGTLRVKRTMREGTQLGRTCRSMMMPLDTPMERAASI